MNYSHNMLSSVGFKRFNAAYDTLRVVDMSHNLIDQDTQALFLNMPLKLEGLLLSNNTVRGSLPNPFPLQKMLRLKMTKNTLNGAQPNLLAPGLKEVDLSNQKDITEDIFGEAFQRKSPNLLICVFLI